MLLTDAEGKPRDMSFLPIGQYGDRLKSEFFPITAACLTALQRGTPPTALSSARGAPPTAYHPQRSGVGHGRPVAEVEESMGRDRLRQMGDILSANLYRAARYVHIRQGLRSEGTHIDIALDPVDPS